MVEKPLENWGNSFHIEFEFLWTKTVHPWENIFMVDGLGSKITNNFKIIGKIPLGFSSRYFVSSKLAKNAIRFKTE